MADVCVYFQFHQPMRLRRYSVFDSEPEYFDDQQNAHWVRTIAERCYLPTTQMLLELIPRLEGRFRLSLSITGLLIDQFRDHCPQMIGRLQELCDTGCVEMLTETYHHSLAFLYSRDEFKEQINLHAAMIEQLFHQTPTIFRNTELIYNNDLAYYVAAQERYAAILAEGPDHVLAGRPPTRTYYPPHTDGLTVMLKHYRLSDDIAFRFSNRQWSEWPLDADKYAGWLGAANGDGGLINLFMDIETFGEHQRRETGIFDFLADLPLRALERGHRFVTAAEAAERYQPAEEFDVPHMISWADTERDLSAWLGNAMQSNALHELYKLEGPVKAKGDERLLEDWRRLTASDHFYYMCTKYYADGAVHKYFNPYESPYDSYINFMNVLDNMRSRIHAR